MIRTSPRSRAALVVILPFLAHACRAEPRSSSKASHAWPGCYALTYSDPVGGATSDMFPALVALEGGPSEGPVASQPAAADSGQIWRMFQLDARWHAPHSDSARLSFSNGFTGVSIELGWNGGRIEGVAQWHPDWIDDNPDPAFRVVARRVACQEASPRTA